MINISKSGQLAMRELLKTYLRRIDRDPSGVPIKLYPFTRPEPSDQPKVIAIDPRISFGRPIIAGTGIPASVIAERYRAGESIQE